MGGEPVIMIAKHKVAGSTRVTRSNPHTSQQIRPAFTVSMPCRNR